MEVVTSLFHGFAAVLSDLSNVFYLLMGIVVGALVGILPGIGSATAIAILLPLIFGKPPLAALILMCGIYFATTYCGAISAILLRIPGESNSVITMIDGHELTKQGRATEALAMSGLASFIGATIGVILLTFLALPISRFALRFGPPEYCAVMIMALVLLAALGSDNILKGFIATVLGLMLGTIGSDPSSGIFRFTFGTIGLLDGINFIPLGIGMFAITDIFINIERGLDFKVSKEGRERVKRKNLFSLIQSVISDLKLCLMPIIRASGIGFLMGILPGTGHMNATFLSYAVEKKLSNHPEKFGKGAIEGVAAPEAANSASNGGAMITMLSIGVPGSKSTAMMLMALVLMGIKPGPMLMTNEPTLAWGLISSLYLANILTLVVVMPFSAIVLSKLIAVTRYSILYPIILAVSILGAFSVKFDVFEIWQIIFFGLLGYFMEKLDLSIISLAIALILGPLFEESLIQAMILSDSNPMIFITRPLSAIMIAISVIIVVSQYISFKDLYHSIFNKSK